MQSSPLRPGSHSPGRPRPRPRGISTTTYQEISARQSNEKQGSTGTPHLLLLEFRRLLIDHDKSVQDGLDTQLAQQEEKHKRALAEAAAEHARVRRNAEIARERVELELERERRHRESEAVIRLEQERAAKAAGEAELHRKETASLERRQQEEAAKAAQEKALLAKRVELDTQREQAAVELAKQKELHEEQAKKRAKEAAASAAKARAEAQNVSSAPAATAAQSTVATATSKAARPTVQAQQPAQTSPPANQATPQTATQVDPESDRLHKQYLSLHKHMKGMREHVITEGKKIPALKSKLGDWRREIVKCMGQLTADKTKNRKPMSQVQGILQESLKFTSPSIDISSYLISVAHPASGQPVPYSGVFVYLLNIFAKCVIRQFISESSGGVRLADPVGVIAVSIFATPAFKVHGTMPLIDVLLAKFHVVCPLLFNMPGGPANTVAGRNALGWWRVDGTFIPEQRHLERMAGLATGWAALTLRDFSKSKNDNPLPNWHYWRALAGVTNTTLSIVGSTQITIIKGLIDGFVPRFIGFYGMPAKAALRVALVDIPARLMSERSGDRVAAQAAGSLVVLREVLQRDLRLTLTD